MKFRPDCFLIGVSYPLFAMRLGSSKGGSCPPRDSQADIPAAAKMVRTMPGPFSNAMSH